MTKQEICTALGITERTLWKWCLKVGLDGKRDSFTYPEVAKIATNIEMAELNGEAVEVKYNDDEQAACIDIPDVEEKSAGETLPVEPPKVELPLVEATASIRSEPVKDTEELAFYKARLKSYEVEKLTKRIKEMEENLRRVEQQLEAAKETLREKEAYIRILEAKNDRLFEAFTERYTYRARSKAGFFARLFKRATV